MAKEPSDQNSATSSLNVFQFDTNSAGKSVNLFRGNVVLPLKLASLPSRNGLSLDINILYQSYIQNEVDTWNLSQPTDVLGLGWSMPYERIILGNKLTGSSFDDTFYLIMQGQSNQLMPIDVVWPRGLLQPSYGQYIKGGAVNPPLLSALRNLGLNLSQNTVLNQASDPNQWNLIDNDNQLIYNLTVADDKTINITSAGQSFEPFNFQYWQIIYYDQYEKWEIIKNDGTTLTYGGKGQAIDRDDNPNTVQWGIKWGNWIGRSLDSSKQQRYAKAWNLSRAENSVGNYIIFNYLTTEQKVGSTGKLTYTKECHLYKIKNDLNWSCNFSYKPMVYDNSKLEAHKEYIDPHLDPMSVPGTNTNAYQSEYNTQYLDNIVILNASSQPQVTIQLNYYDLQNLTIQQQNNPLGYGGTFKRYLKSIQQIYPSGATRPDLSFEYYFAKDVTQNRGALKTITYPAGGIVSYTYDQIQVGADQQSSPGARNLTIANPFDSQNNAAPRIWYGKDYAVCAWYNGGSNQLKLKVFTWNGRWISNQSDWIDFFIVGSVNFLNVSTSENTFLLLIPQGNSTDVNLFNRNKLSTTDWAKQNTKNYDTSILNIVNGKDFYILNGTDTSNNIIMDRYDWDFLNSSWNSQSLQPPTGTTPVYFITAKNNYYVIHCYDQSNNQNQFNIFFRDNLNNWRAGGTFQTFDLIIWDTKRFNISSGNSFISMVSCKLDDPSHFDYTLFTLRWDEIFGDLQLQKLSNDSDGFTSLPIPILQFIGPTIIDDCLIGSGPNVFRFDGANWQYFYLEITDKQACTKDDYYWYSYSTDRAVLIERLKLRI